ncbi:MAG TPA: alpha/beta hydrolase domain-containing protein [Stellaceae bacterium]|nr:alpha/beta hydrolase domain-containing protein [Stellaceae bacterium]
MPITDISVTDIADFAEGHEFGAAGAYLRIKGVARGVLDPAAADNAGVVDLDNTARNAAGRVEYATDFDMLRPKDPSRGSGVLVYDVTNRGNKRILQRLDDAGGDPARLNDPQTREDAGQGFVLGRGHALLWSGWDPGAPRANGGLAGDFPAVLDAGRDVTGRIRDEFHIGTRTPGDGSVHRLPYPAASLKQPGARLAVRDREGDPRRDIARDEWEFIDERTIRLLPAGRKFEPIKIYEVWYEATGARVLGIGFASVRDLVSFCRHGATNIANPLADIRHALAFGVSQSGRFLRHFLELGMNRDSAGRPVFDGVMTHVAGAGKVFANHRFGMPGRTATAHEDRRYPENWFPFAMAATRDPVSGRTDGLLRPDRCAPKVIEVNSATEYWQKGASLIHSDLGWGGDLFPQRDSRVYLVAGTQHGGRADSEPGPCVNPRNPLNAGPALRALFVALEEWVTHGIEPPASRVPASSMGTAVPADTIRLPRVAGFAHPPGANRITSPVDWIDPPEADPEPSYETCVSAVDEDGNEVAGIRLPPVAVPLATYTGWNLYRAQPDALADRDGSMIPFARTRAERRANDDPRDSLEERYGSRRAYVAKVEAAAAELVEERLLLPDDAAAYAAAAARCEAF